MDSDCGEFVGYLSLLYCVLTRKTKGIEQLARPQ